MDLIKNPNFNFLGRRKIMYVFSSAVIIWGLVTFAMRGKENFGVDFIGGDMLNIEFEQEMSVMDIREQIRTLDIGHYTVQSLGVEGKEFIIRSAPDTAEKITAVLALGEAPFMVKGRSHVAPAMSATLRRNAFYAFFAGIIGILLYLTFRFEFRFAVGATLAIFHDILFVVSILAITGKQIDATVVAALLTVAGYSVNDTVVIFDRIRENIRKTRSMDYQSVFNSSINEVLSRTVLTSVTTLFVVCCLFFLGGEAIHLFSLALLAGFFVGTYSSVYIASSVIVDWHKLSPHKFNV